MHPRARVLREMVSQSLYVVDASAVADAMVIRASIAGKVPEVPFRGDARGQEIRSFRRHDAAPSFRLTAGGRLRSVHH